MSLEKLDDAINNIAGINERFATLIRNYVYNYINMSSNKELVANNIINQIKKITGIQYKSLDGISGCVDSLSDVIVINSDLDDWLLDNTFLHEFTHQIAKNEYLDEEDVKTVIQSNLGLKPGMDDQADLSWGTRLRHWEIDGNNYSYNKGIFTLDEWITEWLANKMSGFVNADIKEDTNGFYRKKTSHGYDGSNVMNMLELVYGSQNIANLITGFDLTKKERKGVIPIKEFHKLNQMIDSGTVLSPDEIEIFKNLQPPYMQNPNITGLIVYYISEYQKQDKLEDYNIYIQKMLDVLTRTYSISFENRISKCNDAAELKQLYNELTTIQNSMLWNEDKNVMEQLESYKLFNQMRNIFSSKAIELNIINKEFETLYLTPQQLKEKFKLEQEYVQTSIIKNSVSGKRM